jgi:hypothetical protein
MDERPGGLRGHPRSSPGAQGLTASVTLPILP